MAVANFRFYEELNDFLPPRRRKCAFACVCARGATVKHAIEALGVPHTEVELILANGESVDFSYVVREGDRISVYPVFESLDVTSVLKVRADRCGARDSSRMRSRAVWRSTSGCWASIRSTNGYTDAQVARISADEQRIVLTRDRALLMYKLISHGCYVRGTRPRQQLERLLRGSIFIAPSSPSAGACAATGARTGREGSNRRSAAARKRVPLLPFLDLRQVRQGLLGGVPLAPDGAGHRRPHAAKQRREQPESSLPGVLGAGVNELVAAHTLARAGRSVRSGRGTRLPFPEASGGAVPCGLTARATETPCATEPSVPLLLPYRDGTMSAKYFWSVAQLDEDSDAVDKPAELIARVTVVDLDDGRDLTGCARRSRRIGRRPRSAIRRRIRTPGCAGRAAGTLQRPATRLQVACDASAPAAASLPARCDACRPFLPARGGVIRPRFPAREAGHCPAA